MAQNVSRSPEGPLLVNDSERAPLVGATINATRLKHFAPDLYLAEGWMGFFGANVQVRLVVVRLSGEVNGKIRYVPSV